MSKPKPKVSLAKVFRTIVLPRWKIIMVGIVLIIVSSLSDLTIPLLIKPLIDEVFVKNDMDQLRNIVLFSVAAVIVSSGSSFLLTLLLSVEAQHLISVLRAQVQKHLLRLPLRFFDNNKTGALVSRIMNDVEGVRNLVGTGLVQLVGGTLKAIVCLVILFSINWQLTLYIIVPVIIFGFISMKAFAFIRPVFRERSVINAEVTGRLTETLGGIRVIKGFNAEPQEMKVFEKGVHKLFMNVKKSLVSTSLLTNSGSLLLGFAAAAIMGIGGSMVVKQGASFTQGDLFSFTFLLALMIAPILQMSNIGTQLTEAFAGLDRTEELMNMEQEDDGSLRKTRINEIKGDIEFHDVSFAYEEGKEVVRNISFKAPSGSVTALVGTSGSGKTTIAGLAASFLTPQSGMISVDGEDLSRVTMDSYRSQLGVVLQDDFLFEGTIRENILFPRPDSTIEQLESAVRAAHVHEFTGRFEKGLDTVIGERGVKLSGGQRQRIAIARAILANPRVLILDEATSNLDTESESYIQESLRSLMKGRTTFVIAHRLSTIRQADQILVVERGNIVERGKHDELIAKNGRYFELYTYQARI
jgi:ABC-type multidrug transport system fused ATPase/permease subunit